MSNLAVSEQFGLQNATLLKQRLLSREGKAEASFLLDETLKKILTEQEAIKAIQAYLSETAEKEETQEEQKEAAKSAIVDVVKEKKTTQKTNDLDVSKALEQLEELLSKLQSQAEEEETLLAELAETDSERPLEDLAEEEAADIIAAVPLETTLDEVGIPRPTPESKPLSSEEIEAQKEVLTDFYIKKQLKEQELILQKRQGRIQEGYNRSNRGLGSALDGYYQADWIRQSNPQFSDKASALMGDFASKIQTYKKHKNLYEHQVSKSEELVDTIRFILDSFERNDRTALHNSPIYSSMSTMYRPIVSKQYDGFFPISLTAEAPTLRAERPSSFASEMFKPTASFKHSKEELEEDLNAKVGTAPRLTIPQGGKTNPFG